MSANQRGAIIKTNEFGRLEHLKGPQGNGSFIGTCVFEKRESTNRFRGAKKDVIKRWENWQRVVLESVEAKKQIEDTEVKQEMANTKPTASNDGKVIVLVYANGRTRKNIGAFINKDKALDMATALEAALEVSNADGEYQLDEITFMG